MVGVLVGEYDFWGESLGFFVVHEGVSHDVDYVAHLHLACGCSVESYTTAATLAFDDVGVKAFAIVVVDD